MKSVLHIVPGLDLPWNGIAGAARDLARAYCGRGGSAALLDASAPAAEIASAVAAADEVWVHSMWQPCVWRACRAALHAGCPLVRMPHGCLDPVRTRYHAWRKLLVSPVERLLFARTARVAVTCEEERGWCEAWGVKGPFELVDLRRLYAFAEPAPRRQAGPLHVLYLGRRHPLKGVGYLEAAVTELKSRGTEIELRVESSVYGEEKESAWRWCDVLCLPTLSENFGRVVAEALEYGKTVVTTDGAPVWRDLPSDRGVWLAGFRGGSAAERVKLLTDALGRLADA